MSEFLISITGERASGKTTILMILLNALADAGLLTVPDTRYIAAAPDRFLRDSRIINTDTTEQIEVEICKDSLLLYLNEDLSSDHRVTCDITLDEQLLGSMDLRSLINMEIKRTLDNCEDAGLPMLPLTINLDAFEVTEPN